MRTDTFAKVGRVAVLCGALTILFSLFLIGVRPWYLRWGATHEEAASRLPGDELLVASEQSTRAITIGVPVERVWPWLVQLGQDRGGFYSYAFLENLVGAEMENEDKLRPDLPPWKLGDKLWMYPPDKLGGAGFALLTLLEPGRALVFSTRRIGVESADPFDGTWAFVLRPVDDHTTRLIVRGRATSSRSFALRSFDTLVFEPVHFMMERKMMEGIKARAEGRVASSLSDALELAMYAICFGLFCTAAVRLVRWPLARRWLLVIVGAGLAFQLLTFVQPPWIVGLLLVGALSLLFEFAEQA